MCEHVLPGGGRVGATHHVVSMLAAAEGHLPESFAVCQPLRSSLQAFILRKEDGERQSWRKWSGRTPCLLAGAVPACHGGPRRHDRRAVADPAFRQQPQAAWRSSSRLAPLWALWPPHLHLWACAHFWVLLLRPSPLRPSSACSLGGGAPAAPRPPQ